MYRLLIVDDERRVREGLLSHIDWASLSIQPCGAADDGETALPMLEQMRPDILLTDVQMRRMSGLELSTKAREILPELEVVFISGYSDSEYIREALRLKAVDYVYKPISLQEVERVIRQVTAKLDERARTSAAQSRMQSLLEKSLPLLQERFLCDWWQGRWTNEREILQRIEQLKIPFDARLPMVPLVLGIDSSELEENLAQLALCEAIREGFPRALTCVCAREIDVLIQPADGTEAKALPGRLENLLARLSQREEDAVCASAGIGAAVQSTADFANGIASARAALQNRFFLSGSRVLFFDPEEDRPPCTMPLKMPELLEEHLRAGNRDALERCILEALDRVRQRKDMEDARTLCMQIALSVEAALKSCGAQAGLALPFCSEAQSAGTLDALQASLLQLVGRACGRMESLRAARGGTADAVHGVIEARLSEKLTIEMIAQQLHYSPSYLSMLYKQETGKTIGDAITAARMREAMRLLRETDDMIYEIAVRVGYHEQAHFARLFKRMTGMTPKDYRKQALS